MKSSSFYSRKAEASRELGHWKIADEWAEKAAKARRIERASKTPTLAEIRRQRAQLASACYNAIQTVQDVLDMIDNGDTEGARMALNNLREATRADLTGARARP